MRQKPTRSFPRSILVAGSGWIALSGTGLIIGGDRGSLMLGVASNLVVLYGFWQIQQRRQRGGSDEPDDSE